MSLYFPLYLLSLFRSLILVLNDEQIILGLDSDHETPQFMKHPNHILCAFICII